MSVKRYGSVAALAAEVALDPRLQQQIRDNPSAALRDLADHPLTTDFWIYRIVVLALGLAVLTTLGGGIYLAAIQRPLPDGLVAIGSAAVGAIAGLLAPSPIKSS